MKLLKQFVFDVVAEETIFSEQVVKGNIHPSVTIGFQKESGDFLDRAVERMRQDQALLYLAYMFGPAMMAQAEASRLAPKKKADMVSSGMVAQAIMIWEEANNRFNRQLGPVGRD